MIPAAITARFWAVDGRIGKVTLELDILFNECDGNPCDIL